MKKYIVILIFSIISINNYAQQQDSIGKYKLYFRVNNQLLDKEEVKDNLDSINLVLTTFAQIPPIIYYKPLFALKTNLLYDLATILNIELEIPIGKKFSLSAEWIFPWWKSMNADFTMQLLNGNGALKYWLGDRDKKALLTGWNVGIIGGGGKYDFQIFNKKGYQGEFFNIGLQCGYAHTIGNDFRMEYSIGVGYINSNYEKYSQINNTEYGDIKVVKYPWEKKKLNFFGPTTIKISLVWLIKFKYYINKREK